MDSLAAILRPSKGPQFRECNKRIYRIAHWPIWIFAFLLIPGPLVFNLFTRVADTRVVPWLAVVVLATGLSALWGRLPGTESKPYILRFTEDMPNPLYRRICYTVAWSDLLTFALLNLAGLVDAFATGHWHLRQIYHLAYFPLAGAVWICGMLGQLPRTRSSTKGERMERRYFYAAVWAICAAQVTLGALWKVLPHSHHSDGIKLALYLGVLLVAGSMASVGRLPRTRPIVHTEWAMSD